MCCKQTLSLSAVQVGLCVEIPGAYMCVLQLDTSIATLCACL